MVCIPVYQHMENRDAPIIGSVIGNADYREFFHIGYQIGMCIKSPADPI